MARALLLPLLIMICILARETIGCPGKPKPKPIHGSWLSWSAWSRCSQSCGSRGWKTRTRRCSPPAHGGKPCQGPANERRACFLQSCPMHGSWSSWGAWGACSQSCGDGLKTRIRQCSPPAHGGKPCHGRPDDSEACFIDSCPGETEDPCSQPSGMIGFGRFPIPRWTFSEIEGCYQFSFGGSGGGNANNFATKEDCLRTCKTNSEENNDRVCTDEDGKTYKDGESWVCADGCNSCSCGCSPEHGCFIVSTRMLCSV